MATERVRDISEFELIERLQAALPTGVRSSAAMPIGIGDDAAVWIPPPGESIVITTDSLIETVHFRTDWTSWEDLGWKALAVNVSDVAAMGAAPAVATVSLALTGAELVSEVQALYRGMGEMAAQESVVLAGGDIVRAPHDFGIHVTVLGSTRHGGNVLTRSGAREGDLIAVTGTLGAAAAGLALWLLDPDDPRRDAATADLLRLAWARPQPRVRAGEIALETGATSAMDLSDGLFGDLPKILAASEVAAEIDLTTIPVSAAIRAIFPERYLELATRGGEDYELLLTLRPERLDDLAGQLDESGLSLHVIGTIVAADNPPGQLFVRDLDGTLHPAPAGAFDHFGRARS